MSEEQPNNPLHGITLEKILQTLIDLYGWKALSRRIEIRCFYNEPSIKSSLKFLRRTPWARQEVEDLYLASQRYLGGPYLKTPEKKKTNNEITQTVKDR